MSDMPILRIELEGIKNTVATMFTSNNGEFNKAIKEAFEHQLSMDWVGVKIHEAVKNCINGAIEDVADNFTLRAAIEDAIVEQLIKKMGDGDMKK